jgi:hypothetical protein
VYDNPAIISDDDDYDDNHTKATATTQGTSNSWDNDYKTTTSGSIAPQEDNTPHARQVNFDVNSPTNNNVPAVRVIEEEEDVICGKNDSADLLRWHHQLNRIPMKKVQMMAG